MFQSEPTEELAQGSDTIKLSARGWWDPRDRAWDKIGEGVEIKATWNSLFEAIAPLMASQSSKAGWKAALDQRCLELHHEAVDRAKAAMDFARKLDLIELPEKEVSRIVLQFRALGLIKARGSGGGFVLTDYGDRLALALSAIKRSKTSKHEK